MATRFYRASAAALKDPELFSQCEMYLLTAAVPSILGEPADTPNHDSRIAWARTVESDQFRREQVVKRLVLKAIANGTVREGLAETGRAADSDVEYVGANSLDELIALGA